MGENLFRDIQNWKVLPMLKSLPYQHGGMNVSASDGRYLYDLILRMSYQRGLEIGTSNGYSGLWLGSALKERLGTLITIDVEPRRAPEARENFRKAGLQAVIDSRINDAFQELALLEDSFDFVFIDAWKPDYCRYLETVLPRVDVGGAIVAHNV